MAALPLIGRIMRTGAGQPTSNDIAFYWIVVSATLAFVAIILGVVALIRSPQARGWAIAGIVIGLLQMAVYTIGFIRS